MFLEARFLSIYEMFIARSLASLRLSNFVYFYNSRAARALVCCNAFLCASLKDNTSSLFILGRSAVKSYCATSIFCLILSFSLIKVITILFFSLYANFDMIPSSCLASIFFNAALICLMVWLPFI